MSVVERFTLKEGDFELVDENVEKYNPNRDSEGRFASGTGFATSTDLHANLQQHLDPISNKINALPSHPAIKQDVAQAKVNIHAASKAPTKLGSSTKLQNADLNLRSAAKKVSGTSTPLAITLADISKDVRRLTEALRRP